MTNEIWLVKVEVFLERLSVILGLDEETKKEFKGKIYRGLFSRIGESLEEYLTEEEKADYEARIKTAGTDTGKLEVIVAEIVKETAKKVGGSIGIKDKLEEMTDYLLSGLKGKLKQEETDELRKLANFY